MAYDPDRDVAVQDEELGAVAVTDHDHTRVVHDRDKFSIGATFLGWAVASFLSAIFLGIVGAILAATFIQDATVALTMNELQNMGIAGAIGGLIAMFLGYLIGGYAAGRIGHWKGAVHGAVVPVWTILFAIIAAIFGGIAGMEFVGLANAFAGFDVTNLTVGVVVGVILMLAAMFGGAILGGKLGEEGDEEYLGYAEARRVTRGRPLS